MKGIVTASIVPVRAHPSEISEMVTQLLFGEPITIQDQKDGWLLVKSSLDDYEGWIDGKSSYQVLPDHDKAGLLGEGSMLVDAISAKAENESDHLPVHLVKGSILPGFTGEGFKVGENTYSFMGSVCDIPVKPDLSLIQKHALSYINVPYLWGGRTPFGIDCSGFVQQVFRFCGSFIPRDADQQVQKGEEVSFLHEVLPGDLAFFDNSAGNIIHVGILLGENQIIHASGCVRIDTIDHLGIFRKETGKYTHNLRIVKRMLSE